MPIGTNNWDVETYRDKLENCMYDFTNFFQWKILGLENIISLRIFGVKTRQQTEISHKNQESINH